ncbi:MAG: alanine racemase [Verrucomicrobia bacterium]|nr:alanine racemase [Verrucomicrobiota bacterium]
MSATADGRLVRTWAEIDLDALRHNVRTVRTLVGTATRLLATVKADAYGHGYERISRTLVEEGVDFLGVANVVEALQVSETLNHTGRPVRIMTLGANLPDEMDAVIANGFVPLVCSWDEAAAYSARAAAAGVTLDVHVKIDTGMGRIGLWHEGCVNEIERIAALPNLRLEGVATHFPSADEEDQAFSHEQLDVFNAVLAAIEARGVHVALRHAANSSAIAHLPESRFNMVRPGLVLYGHHPSAHLAEQHHLDVRPVLALKTRVVFVKDVGPGRTISYGRTFTAPGPIRVATLAIGYGDGYSRELSNRGEVLIAGRRARILGTVTMDQTMVDVTSIPETRVGGEAVLIGRQGGEAITVAELAAQIGTIPYIVTCSISKRVIRRYIEHP